MDMITLAAAKQYTRETVKGMGALVGPQGPPGADGAQGPQGNPGPAGEAGFSPTVAVQGINGGHKVTITDKNGPKAFDVMDGKDGAGGTEGTPVSVVTEVEFNALTDAEKESDVLYVITDDLSGGSSGGAAGSVYSSKETRIGTWFNKPLYRRGFLKSDVSVSENVMNTEIGRLSAECRVVRLYGNYEFVSDELQNIYSIPFLEFDSGDFRYACAMVYNNGIILKTKLYPGWKINVNVFAEYTKTAEPEETHEFRI